MFINWGAADLYNILCTARGLEGQLTHMSSYFIFCVRRCVLFVICTDREASELLDRIKFKKYTILPSDEKRCTSVYIPVPIHIILCTFGS